MYKTTYISVFERYIFSVSGSLGAITLAVNIAEGCRDPGPRAVSSMSDVRRNILFATLLEWQIQCGYVFEHSLSVEVEDLK